MALCSQELLPPGAEVIKDVKELFLTGWDVGFDAWLCSKGNKITSSLCDACAAPALGAGGTILLSEVFWRDRTVPEFLQPPQGPHRAKVMLQGAGWLEPGLEQLWLKLRGSGGWRVLGSPQMQQRGPGEAEGAGRGLGGLWRRLVCRSWGEQRRRQMREVPWIPVGGHQDAAVDPWWPKPLKLLAMDPVG